ncbi:SIMPL domain-containing protein [Rhizobiales bacterium L72]|uniref:SIMPL domain-containing protein n=2 Tax=Propylenella binzhouense TaxID=2555902 RepID=A0A964T576_9HYPH|nr:SIMPL domain-containing protein [Propylenella binzhouense]
MTRALALFPLLACLAAAPAFAQSAAPSPIPERRIVVTGTGEAVAKPDMATLELGVVTEDSTAAAALSANNQAMARIVEDLKSAGIEPRDLQTAGLDIAPRYTRPDPNENRAPEIAGYTVRNQLRIRIRDLAAVGATLDRAVGLGANSLSGPAFTLADTSGLEAEARRKAVADAKARAELYARAAGIGLGRVLRIDENGGERPYPVAAPRMMKAEAFDAAMPVEGGELTISASVTMTWAIAD